MDKSRDNCNIGHIHKIQDEDSQQKKNIHTQNNIICVGNQYTQTATNNVKKT
jgi:hypothetical protein